MTVISYKNLILVAEEIQAVVPENDTSFTIHLRHSAQIALEFDTPTEARVVSDLIFHTLAELGTVRVSTSKL
jgi:hypothetical protein